MEEKEDNQRAIEFLSCLGKGKTLDQIESEEAMEEEE
jgi:hypothetical protein